MKITVEEQNYIIASKEVENAGDDVAFYSFQLSHLTENLPSISVLKHIDNLEILNKIAKVKKQLKQAEKLLILTKANERAAWASYQKKLELSR